jgi:glycerol uptake facilitator-like aquaporin
MNQRALAAELIGTFMLMSSVLGAMFYSFAAPMGAAGIFGVALSMLHAGLISVFLIETLLRAFLVFVIIGATSRRALAGFAPIAIGLTLTAIHASVNPARSLGSAVFAGGTALRQLWVFWVAPILGGVIGGSIARWLQEEGGA